MRFGFFPSLVLVAVALPSCHAQNSDLGILFTAFHRRFDFGARSEHQYSIGIHANYAWQLSERRTGRLYLEFPLAAIGHPVGRRGGILPVSESRSVITRPGGAIFFTPGMRYHYNLTSRVAIYGAVGGGAAAMRREVLHLRVVPAPSVLESRAEDWSVHAAFNYGGGLDFRLSRLLSLRGELRQFRLANPNDQSNQFPSVQVGFAFHF